jgi:hypothetical protein
VRSFRNATPQLALRGANHKIFPAKSKLRGGITEFLRMRMLTTAQQVQQWRPYFGPMLRMLIYISQCSHDQVDRGLDRRQHLEKVEKALGLDDAVTHGRIGRGKKQTTDTCPRRPDAAIQQKIDRVPVLRMKCEVHGHPAKNGVDPNVDNQSPLPDFHFFVRESERG